MANWFVICDKVTGLPISFATDDSQGFDAAKLQAKFDVVAIPHQPAVDEMFDAKTKTVKGSK